MTLNITCVAPWGIWQSSDHRISLANARGQFLGVDDDATAKDLHLDCQDGVALITYCGLGRIGNRSIVDWARAKLRGEYRTVKESLELLTEKATRQLGRSSARSGHPLVFSIGAFVNRDAWFCHIHNVLTVGTLVPDPTGQFKIAATKIDRDPKVFMTPPGIDAAVSPEDRQMLERVHCVRAKRQEDFQDLLAAVNLRASESSFGKTISPSCTTTFLPPGGEPLESKVHGQHEPVDTPVVFMGVDFTEDMALLFDTVRRMEAGEDPGNLDEAHERAGRLSTTPED